MSVLSIKVLLRKKSGNLSNASRIYIYIYLNLPKAEIVAYFQLEVVLLILN